MASYLPSDSGCEITILFMLDIFQLNLVNLFCDIFKSLYSQFNLNHDYLEVTTLIFEFIPHPVFVGDEASLHELQVTKSSQRLP